LSKYKDKLEEWQCRTGHEAANELRGQIAEVMSEKDFGYVMTKEGGLLYFHRNSVLSREFDKLRRGDEVTYVEDMGRTYCQQSSIVENG
jgi:cold shock CspA family protein